MNIDEILQALLDHINNDSGKGNTTLDREAADMISGLSEELSMVKKDLKYVKRELERLTEQISTDTDDGK